MKIAIRRLAAAAALLAVVVPVALTKEAPSVGSRGPELARVQRLAYLKLKEKYQATNPFKFIVYSARLKETEGVGN